MQVFAEDPAKLRSPLTCLIVDDSAFMRFHLKRMMDSFDNVIASEAANGTEAIREYGRLKSDIVLMVSKR
jgi:two-component system, chemotaxis family, chemotaxis protein CheY